MRWVTPLLTLFPYTTLFRSLLPVLRVELRVRLLHRPAGLRQLLERDADVADDLGRRAVVVVHLRGALVDEIGRATSELQSPCNLVCRLLPEKKITRI